jgi:hypothetical protein
MPKQIPPKKQNKPSPSALPDRDKSVSMTRVSLEGYDIRVRDSDKKVIIVGLE